MLFVRPGDVRHSKLRFKCFYLHMDLTDSEMLKYLENVPTSLAVANSKIYYNIFHQLIQIRNEKNIESRLLYFSKVEALLVNIQRDSRFYSGEGKSSVIYRAERFMTENFTDKIGINYAKELIMTSDHDMMEISMLSGFGSQAYFNYCFKHATERFPIKYREKEFEKYRV